MGTGEEANLNVRGALSRGLGTARYLDYTGVPLLAARLVLGVSFIYMGYLKYRQPFEFLKTLRQFDMLPDSSTAWLDGAYVLNLTALYLPWIEMVCGVLLLLGVAVRGAALTMLVSLMAFTAAVYARSRLQFGDQHPCDVVFDCGCGSGPVNVCAKMATNAGLIIVAGIALSSQSRRFCFSHLFWRRRVRQAAPCARCGYELRGVMEQVCPECQAPRTA